MTIKNNIKPNEELYGDFELIPLNLDAVQQRIDFFRERCDDMFKEDKFDYPLFNKMYSAFTFWEGIKKEHCEVEI